MKTALLICDHVQVKLSDVHGTYLEMYANLLHGVEFDAFYVIDNEFPNPEDYDAFVVTGSKYSVYDDIKWITELKQLTTDIYHLEQKLLGICFGHQLIAEALGGKVNKSEHGYQIGIHNFEFVKNKSWMQPETTHYNMLMLCQDQVNILPPGANVLSTSPNCPIGMFEVGDHFLGIQGHPEFTKEYNKAVFESRVEKIGSEKVAKAIASLNVNINRELVQSFIISFLNS